jgi:hypothetical protein
MHLSRCWSCRYQQGVCLRVFWSDIIWEVADCHLTFSGRAADANLGSIRDESIGYERGCAITLSLLTSLFYRLSASLVGGSNISGTHRVHLSGDSEGPVGGVMAQGRGAYSGQHNEKKRQKSEKEGHIDKLKASIGSVRSPTQIFSAR